MWNEQGKFSVVMPVPGEGDDGYPKNWWFWTIAPALFWYAGMAVAAWAYLS